MVDLGIELEFWAKNLPYSIIDKYNIQNEYYPNMYEVNNFLFTNLKSEKEIYESLTKVLNIVKKMKDEINATGGKCFISSRGKVIDSKSVIWNGLHIHINIDTPENTYNLYKSCRYKNIFEKFKLNRLPSFRSLYSHHIWGYHRVYSYNYKTRRKFQPVIFNNNYNTMEVRIFDNEDLIYKWRREQLSKLIWETVKNFKKGLPLKNYGGLPVMGCGESLKELADHIRRIWSNDQNLSLRHKILEDDGDYLKFQSNYQTFELINIDSVDEYIRSLNKEI